MPGWSGTAFCFRPETDNLLKMGLNYSIDFAVL